MPEDIERAEGMEETMKNQKWMAASDIHGSAYYCGKLLEAYEREGADRLLLWEIFCTMVPGMICRRSMHRKG